jgi:hypothetical protein
MAQFEAQCDALVWVSVFNRPTGRQLQLKEFLAGLDVLGVPPGNMEPAPPGDDLVMPFSGDAFKSDQPALIRRRIEPREHVMPIVLRGPQFALWYIIRICDFPLIWRNVLKASHSEELAKASELGLEFGIAGLKSRVDIASFSPIIMISIILNLNDAIV